MHKAVSASRCRLGEAGPGRGVALRKKTAGPRRGLAPEESTGRVEQQIKRGGKKKKAG